MSPHRSFTDANRLESLIDLLRSCGNTKPSRVLVPDEVVMMRCQCAERRPRDQMPLRDSGVVRFRDNVCPGCKAVDRSWAKLVCIGCKEVVLHVEPGTDPVDNFTFERGRTYHVMTCAACRLEQQTVDIIERLLWRQRNPVPLKTTIPLSS